LNKEKEFMSLKIIIETLKRSKGAKEVTPRTIYRKTNSLEEEEKREELHKKALKKEEDSQTL
tara:strand:- start:1346 stop:1531 length:186 start_codon:yes stop_codon:yes gene_type:complete